MKRAERLTLITSIITSHQIATQEDLQVYLEREGVEITQATLSRDIRELNIIKKNVKMAKVFTRFWLMKIKNLIPIYKCISLDLL